MKPEALLERLRAEIAAFPETHEKISHGAPFFWGGKKTFAAFHNGSYDDGQPGVWVLVPDGQQQRLIEHNPALYYRPKYLGPKGWVGRRLLEKVDWADVRELLLEGYYMVAPDRAIEALEAQTPEVRRT